MLVIVLEILHSKHIIHGLKVELIVSPDCFENYYYYFLKLFILNQSTNILTFQGCKEGDSTEAFVSGAEM